MKFVIDISHWETVTDWARVAEQCDGVYLKATQGTWLKDNVFEKYRKGCESVSLPWGAYHFYESASTGLAQANYFIDAFNGNYGQLPPCLDYEPVNRPARTAGLASIKSFMTVFEDKTGKKPIFYSNPDNIHFLKPIPDWLLGYGLWLANYKVDVPDVEPWAKYVMWQFSDAGSIEGIDDAVDMNWAQDDFVSHVTQPELTLEQKVEKLWNDHYKIFPV
jgi:lysozyme